MAQSIINFDTESNITLLKIKQLAKLNGIVLTTKEAQVQLALQWLSELFLRLDEQDVNNILGIKTK